MVKIKVTADIVNRGGKSYKATNWIIEVAEQDIEFFKWFTKVEEPKKITKKKWK